MKYRSCLFTQNGEWVIAFCGRTINEVEERMDNFTSRCRFYPFRWFIIEDRGESKYQCVLKAYKPYKFLEGKTIEVVSKYFRAYNKIQDKLTEKEIKTVLRRFYKQVES